MALYEYKCTNNGCSNEFEVRMPVEELDKKEVLCPVCNSAADRQISVAKATHSTWKNWRL